MTHKEGGLKAAETNKRKHGEDFYVELGRMGGKAKHPGKGFGSFSKEKVLAASLKGHETRRRNAEKLKSKSQRESVGSV